MAEKEKPKALLVEDDESVRAYIKKLLTKNGFDITEVEDGRAAIELYEDKSRAFDVIVCDLRMPRVGGIEFARYNYENRLLPFVVCRSAFQIHPPAPYIQ